MEPNPDISHEDAVASSPEEPTAEVRLWQQAKIEHALREADAGRFASAERVRQVIQKFVPNG